MLLANPELEGSRRLQMERFPETARSGNYHRPLLDNNLSQIEVKVVEELQMWIRTLRILFIATLLSFAALGAEPASAQLPTPSQPILVVQDSTSTDPYQNFVPELLTTEGLNGFQTAQLSALTSTFLTNYDVVILPHLALTADEATLFQNYVSAGGTLIGFRPDLQLANVFGVTSLSGTTLQESWLKIDNTKTYAPAGPSSLLKFHGAADLYSLNGASALATLYNTSMVQTLSPAVSIFTFGQGTSILFSFDLTQTIVLMRQGNPAWAGYPNTYDGYNTMRASQMFMNQNTGQFWNDLGDGALNDVPQADIEMRLFSNALTLTNAAKRPLPRLWYYPNQSPSLVLMTADDHTYPVSDALTEFNFIASYGGLFSYNLFDPFLTIDPTQVASWLAAGNTMGIHFNDTAEVDSSGIGGSAATWNGMQGVIAMAFSDFATTYPSAPVPVTARNHYIMWVSNDADGTADQVANARLFQNNGIQLDTSYSAFPNRWGYMTGSGLPMKFLDTKVGAINPVIPVYEQATQYEDDVQLGSAPSGYNLGWGMSTAQSHYLLTLSDSFTKYNEVTTFLFHPENWSNYQSYAQAALQYAQTNSIPMSTTGSWLSFWQARAGTTFSMPTFTSGTLAFTATGAPAGLTVLVPEASGSNMTVSTVSGRRFLAKLHGYELPGCAVRQHGDGDGWDTQHISHLRRGWQNPGNDFAQRGGTDNYSSSAGRIDFANGFRGIRRDLRGRSVAGGDLYSYADLFFKLHFFANFPIDFGGFVGCPERQFHRDFSILHGRDDLHHADSSAHQQLRWSLIELRDGHGVYERRVGRNYRDSLLESSERDRDAYRAHLDQHGLIARFGNFHE